MPKNDLNLLILDDEQLYAEKLSELINIPLVSTHLVLADEKEELLKMLRRPLDVIVHGNAFDITPFDTLSILRNNGLDVPVIALISDDKPTVGSSDCSGDQAVELMKAGVRHAPDRCAISLIAELIKREFETLTIRRELRQTQNLLEHSDSRNQALLRQLKSSVAFIVEGAHLYANQSYLDLFGYKDSRELLGTPVIDLISPDDTQAFKDQLKGFSKGDLPDKDLKLSFLTQNQSDFEALVQMSPASYDGQPCIQLIIQPKFDHQSSAGLLAVSDQTDALTGLMNRQGFEAKLKQSVSAAIKKQTQNGLMFVSIDNMGQINNTFGIEGTDSVIIHVARRLSEKHKKAVISRFGESTFALLIPDTKKDELLAHANELLELIDKDLIPIGNKTARTSLSIGLALINETSPSSIDIFNRAYKGIDRVRQKTKGAGNGVSLYDPLEEASQSESALFETVNNALDQNLFKLLYQPIYDINSGQSNFHEVYLRLPLPDGTSMTPDKFLHIAEQANMLERLDRWVMLNAAKNLRGALKQDPNSRLLINLSGNALQDTGLPEFASKLVKAIGAETAPITLQFSEPDIVKYLGQARSQFDAFKKAGCNLSINAFGASTKAIELFDYITPNMVKLDRAYTSNLTNDEQSQGTATFIKDISRHQVKSMIAFIEDAPTMSQSWTIGADFLQGIYLQSPGDHIVVPDTDKA